MRWGCYSQGPVVTAAVCVLEGVRLSGSPSPHIGSPSVYFVPFMYNIALGTKGQPRVGENLVSKGQPRVTTEKMVWGAHHRCGES